MLETYFATPKMLGHLRSGPSGPHLDGFAALLQEGGYSPAAAVRYLRAAAHLGHFQHDHGGTLAEIELATFAEHLRTCLCPRSKGGRRNHHTVYGAKHFRDFLVAIGVCRPIADPSTKELVEPEVIAGFRVWLGKHRGAAAPTIRLYVRDAGWLVTALADDPTSWTATTVRNAFMERTSQHMVALATYLGHVNIYSTYWYLEATADLMRDIGAAGEAFLLGERPS